MAAGLRPWGGLPPAWAGLPPAAGTGTGTVAAGGTATVTDAGECG